MTARHPFELTGHGPGPYRVTGWSKNVYTTAGGAHQQPGGSCDHCGTGIMYEVHVQAADGTRFKVGTDCAAKAYRDAKDYPSQAKVDQIKRKIQRDVRHARETARIEAGTALLETLRPTLAARPHPLAWRAEQGDTLADWADWMMANAGNAGRIKVCRMLEKQGGAR